LICTLKTHVALETLELKKASNTREGEKMKINKFSTFHL